MKKLAYIIVCLGFILSCVAQEGFSQDEENKAEEPGVNNAGPTQDINQEKANEEEGTPLEKAISAEKAALEKEKLINLHKKVSERLSSHRSFDRLDNE